MSDSQPTYQQKIERAMQRDQFPLRNRLKKLAAIPDQQHQDWQAFRKSLEDSMTRRALRLQQLPSPTFDLDLPINQRRDDIAKLISEHQVLVLCGETGSGKTTQLPKICLTLGRGVRGMIGHTQPRRLAARTVAQRIAQELKTSIGEQVGFKVRFLDETSDSAYIKLMTDGILLNEIQQDPYLEAYDTLIIDEAHERSLNIDFLLGYLQRILPRRPDLKLIITSATIDPQKFSKLFHHAPILEVSGRTYPVETIYRPLKEEDQKESLSVPEATDALVGEIEASRKAGDILVFLSGEREIRDVADQVRKSQHQNLVILPLYAKLNNAQQAQIFEPNRKRKLVLSTNVAETSLTVPGIVFVIDQGDARISRYSYQSKVQRLPIERISQASANQRQGRCGRVSPGVCYRLYAENDFQSRVAFTDPELLRTNLASVILQMKYLKLGEIHQFPFIDPPQAKQINAGIQLLLELQALSKDHGLTDLGRKIARIPVDPKIARICLEGAKRGCLQEMLVIGSAMSIQDPRERPFEQQQKADEKHRKFSHEQSDFMSWLALWRFYHEQAALVSRSQLRRVCKENFLSYVRMVEWGELYRQLKRVMQDLGCRINEVEAEAAAIHQSLLPGLLGNVGLLQDNGEYLGARNVRFNIFPGSGVRKKKPKWIVCGELLETSRLYAHAIAQVQPEWIEAAATHLLKHAYADPHWNANTQKVDAYERVSLFGLPLIVNRKINYGAISPKESFEIFIREALVIGGIRTHLSFFHHNQKLVQEVEKLEHKSRRKDVLVDEEALYQFYVERIPADVGIVDTATFHQWHQKLPSIMQEGLFLSQQDLMRHDAEDITQEKFPVLWKVDDLELPLIYQFDPGHPADGVTLVVPLGLLNRLDAVSFQWLVPGLLEEKLIWMTKSLPKHIRKFLVPVPDTVTKVLDAGLDSSTLLTQALAVALSGISGMHIDQQFFQELDMPAHLRMNFRIVEDDKVMAEDRDLSGLQQRFASQAQTSFFAGVDNRIERTGLLQWDFGDLPVTKNIQVKGMQTKAYVALLDQEDSVAIGLLDTESEAMAAHHAGVVRCLKLSMGAEYRQTLKKLPKADQLCLLFSRIAGVAALQEKGFALCPWMQEMLADLAMEAIFFHGEEIRTQAAFAACLAKRSQWRNKLDELAVMLRVVLEQYHRLLLKINELPVSLGFLKLDLQAQLAFLIHPHFLKQTALEWLEQYPRYLAGIEKRLEKQSRDPAKDKRLQEEIGFYTSKLDKMIRVKPEIISLPGYLLFRWQLEEYRISLFAQELKTKIPVSKKRLDDVLAQLEKS